MRIQFEMSTEKVNDLDRLKEQTALRTRREVFDNALTFFEWGVNESANGHLVAAVDEESGLYQPIVMPVFSAARRRAQAGGTKPRRPQRAALRRRP
jgi:hypothetical protein